VNLVIEATKRFEKDLQALSSIDRERVLKTVRDKVEEFDPSVRAGSRHITQPMRIAVPGGYDSSLYSLRVGQKIRVLLTVEDDPIFEEKLVTLMRVVKHGDLNKAYRSLAESLAQSFASGGDLDG